MKLYEKPELIAANGDIQKLAKRYNDLISSEKNDKLPEEEAMKENVKDTLNFQIKLQIIFACITFVSEVLGYFFISLSPI